MDCFEEQISSNGKPYYRNKLTNETQWGLKTYYNKKRLPKGWVRLNLHGKPIHKYIKRNKKVSSKYSSYAPRELEEILRMSYQDLIDQEEQEEACRRNNLFEKVALLLKVSSDSICDESLEFLCKGKDVTVETIISFIQETEIEKLEKKADQSAFSTIKSSDIHFLSERSLRELCGVNIRETEAKQAIKQIEDQFTCLITHVMFTDPVTCSSGHTFEREAIIKVYNINGRCPITRMRITGYFVPNYALRKVIDQFIEKYNNQKGDHWAPILEFCDTYKNYHNERLQVPVDLTLERPPDDDPEEEIPPDERPPDDNPEDDDPEDYDPEDAVTGRNSNEIRTVLLENGFRDINIDNIPEVVASSEDSSYNHALAEIIKREENPRYKHAHRSRTAEELLEYYISVNPDMEDILSRIGYGVAVQAANSPYNSYARVLLFMNRRLRR